MASTVLIGLTGPIGCGKSTIGQWLRQAGASVIDADAVARAVVGAGEPALEAVIERFGADLRQPDGSLDRGALGRIVFGDPAALRDLEAIVHPAVRPRILGAVEAARALGSEAVVIEAIKLVEGGLAELCDEVWLVTCDRDEQIRRLGGRGMDADEAARRVAAQGDVRDRLASHATRVVDTSGTPEAARADVLAAYADAVGRQT